MATSAFMPSPLLKPGTPQATNPAAVPGSYYAATNPNAGVAAFQAPSTAPNFASAAPPLTYQQKQKPPPILAAPQPVSTTRPPAPSTGAFAPGTQPLAPGGAPRPPTAASNSPLQDPGNNMVNQGYGEQALNLTQNRLLNDPAAGQLQTQYNNANTPTQGQDYQHQNLGTLDGPGQGDQQWNQVKGQFNSPFAGEQFTREAAQNFSPTGAAGAFNTGAQARSDQFTNFQGPGNSQSQLGTSQQQLANGTQGEQGLGAIAGQYDSQGKFTDPNLAAGQYAQTQGAFGDLPIANFDPFYDRASQLGVQNYNRQAAGRGVYGSSEALSGVGNVITDIEAQRANRSFDAEMQRTQEQRARQQLLGEQARQGDLSAQGAFAQNLQGATTYGNLNEAQGKLEIERNQTLGQMANNADSQALGAQNSNISGLNALGSAAQAADTAETSRFNASTGAMNAADQTQQTRLNSGVTNALNVDANTRNDFTASQNAAQASAQTDQNQTRLAADIANQASQNDLNRINAFNNTAQGAEGQRQARQIQKMADQFKLNDQVQESISGALESASKYGADGFDAFVKAEIAPALQDAGLSEREKTDLINGLKESFDDAVRLAGK